MSAQESQLGEFIMRLNDVLEVECRFRVRHVYRIAVESRSLESMHPKERGAEFQIEADLMRKLLVRSTSDALLPEAFVASLFADEFEKSAFGLRLDGGGRVGIAVCERLSVGTSEMELGFFTELAAAISAVAMRNIGSAENEAKANWPGAPENSEPVVGEKAGLRSVFEKVEIVCATDLPVLLFGETGSGKEVVARSIHQGSRRREKPFVRVNCGAISPSLIDSELFGFEKGAFTGASSNRKGWFERANGGTLFLDEIGEMSESVQVRLLRVLQDGTFDRVGSEKSVRVDVRIIAATHRNLARMVDEGQFREDLWYRISTFPIEIPPLRERFEDLPDLARAFVARAAFRFGVLAPELAREDIDLLSRYSWPGNIRELEAVLARAVLLAKEGRVDLRSAMGLNAGSGERVRTAASTVATKSDIAESVSLEGLQRLHIERTLQETLGRIEGPFGAARVLKIHPNTLRSRLRKLGIDARKFRKAG